MERKPERQKAVITRVPRSLHDIISRQAKEQLLSTSAYVRTLLLKACTQENRAANDLGKRYPTRYGQTSWARQGSAVPKACPMNLRQHTDDGIIASAYWSSYVVRTCRERPKQS